MDPVLGESLVDHGAVAPPAQLETDPFGFKWTPRGRFEMALGAILVCHRPVHRIVEDGRLVRTMRIMTTGAPGFFDRIIQVLSREGRCIRTMALHTKGGHPFLQ